MNQRPFQLSDGVVECSEDHVLPDAVHRAAALRLTVRCWKCGRRATLPAGGHLAAAVLEHPQIYHLVIL